jgi:hypothetical protein
LPKSPFENLSIIPLGGQRFVGGSKLAKSEGNAQSA